MPKVATYGNQKQSTQFTRSPQASASDGNQVFQAQRQVADKLGDVGVATSQVMHQIDITTAEEALVQFEKEKNKLFFDPDSGYFNTQGKNAFDLAQPTTEALIKLQKQYGDKLNTNARNMFNKASEAQITRSQADVMRHSSKGLKAWEVATINAQTENTLENSALYWNQPDQLRVQNALGRQSVLDGAKIEGIGAEATNEKLQTYDSSFYKSVLTAAVYHDSEQAEELFEKHSSKLEGPDRLKIEDLIARKKKEEKLQRDSINALNTAKVLVERHDQRKEVVEKVNEIEDEELRKKTMTEAMIQFNLKKKAESELRAQAFETGESYILDGLGLIQFQSDHPEMWSRLSPKQQRSLESGKLVQTDWSLFSDLILKPKSELAKVDPVDYFDELAPAERSKLITAVKAANGTGSQSEKADLQIGRTRNAQVLSSIEQILGKKSKWDDDEKKQADAFYELLNAEVDHREEQKGGRLSSQEFTDVLADLTRKSVLDEGIFFDTTGDLSDIPPEYISVLSEFLRENNIPVNSETILEAYKLNNN